MKTYKDTIIFNASAQRLYDILTKQHLHSLVTDAEVELQQKVDSEFKFFGGAIEGKILALDPAQKIKWSWICYVHGWEQGHVSFVEISLYDIDTNNCALKIEHTNIPEDAYELVVDGWKERYWGPIKNFVKK